MPTMSLKLIRRAGLARSNLDDHIWGPAASSARFSSRPCGRWTLESLSSLRYGQLTSSRCAQF